MPYTAALDGGPLIEQDEDARDALIQRYPQYEDTIESMHRNGFAVIDPKYYLYDLDEARSLCENSVPNKAGVQNAWMSNRAIENIATHASVIRLLSCLYGRRAFPFQTMNLAHGTERKACADAYHFNSRPHGFMCSVWVALEDVDENAGPLFYYPESHKRPYTDRRDLEGARSYADYERHIGAQVIARDFKQQQARLQKGQAVILAANLLHGGSPRLNPALTRCTQVTHYFFEGCAYFSPILEDEADSKNSILEPFDIARRRFVKSNQDLLPGRPDLLHRLAPQLAIWRGVLQRILAID